MSNQCHTQELFKRGGLSTNHNRQMILKILNQSPHALSPKDILTQLKKKKPFDKVTLYRILDLFVAKKILRRIATNGSMHYEVICHLHHPVHAHFICQDCGTVECLHDHTLNHLLRQVQKRHSKPGEHIDLKLEGQCQQCRSAG